MTRLNLFLIGAFLALCATGFCKVLPAENTRLNYTTVYFEENLIKDAMEYKLSVYSDSLLTHPVAAISNTLPAFWVPDMGWATTYYWKVSAYAKDGKELKAGGLHRFFIIKIVYQNYDEIRIDVKKNKVDKNAGGLISIDYTKSIINRQGKQVWVIPPIDSLPPGKMYIRDMRITHDNTITFLTFQVPYEMDFNGKILWQAPFPYAFNNDSIIYHHDFKKTTRGTYMVLADKAVYRRILGNYSDKDIKNTPDVKIIKGDYYKKTFITMVLEFNKKGEVIWFWDANDYIHDLDLNARKIEGTTPNFASHANAFSENAEGTKLYVGFRDLSRIIKVDKKTKKVEMSYGERFPSGEAKIRVKMNNQHDANVTDHNSIYVFNNNGFKNTFGVSSILELKDNIKVSDSSHAVIWDFDLNFDTLTRGKSVNGGNIVELPNKNLLFCGGSLHRIFEITKSKEIVWDALLFARGIKDTLWQMFPQYRTNWIKQLNWYHFIPQVSAPLVKEGARCELNVILNNTGNIKDAYELKVVSEKGILLYNETTPYVNEGSGFLQKINFKTKEDLKNLKILVKSKNSDENQEMLIN